MHWGLKLCFVFLAAQDVVAEECEKVVNFWAEV